MIKPKHFLLLTILVCSFACKNERRHTYAIKDFRKSLQPFLQKIVSTGYVTYHDSADIKSITDKELIRLGKSENPALRATALREMLDRKSFDHFDVVMKHLDDTAVVATDHGEFGITFETVSDYIIGRSYWETPQAKAKTVEQVLTKHNYLRAAYTILNNSDPQEKFYPYIKEMATRPRRVEQHEGYELGFRDIEYALYGLAKFKKKEDISIIKAKLVKHSGELSDVSFRLMKEFPDTAYLDVLQDFHRWGFYRFSGNRPYGFSGYNSDRVAPEDFIKALVAQQNDRSAKILDTMLTFLPKFTCMPDQENIIDAVIEEIWEHPCPAYAGLRAKVENKARKILEGRSEVSLDPIIPDITWDTTRKTYSWYN